MHQEKTKLIRYRIFSSGPATVLVRIGGREVVTKLPKGGTTPRLTIKVASRITSKLKKLSFRVEVTTSGPRTKPVRSEFPWPLSPNVHASI